METPQSSAVPRDCHLAVLYAATIGLGAFLLFEIQPLISKRILPWFGGTPAVWTTCLLFFQAMLFAGYAYAHITRHWLSGKWQAIVHWTLLAAAIALAGVLPNSNWQPAGNENPVGSILVILAATVGLPFFVLATTAPLVQSWFALSFPGRSPYRLYALSNLGSLLALLSYAFFFERTFDLPRQAAIWSWAFIAYATLCALATTQPWRKNRTLLLVEDSRWRREGASTQHPARTDLALWLLLPAFGTIALMATTNHVCTDVAVVPLLWVVPLALYLTTYIIAFDHPRWHHPTFVAAVTLAAVYCSALLFHTGIGEVDLYDCATTGRIYRIARDGLLSSLVSDSVVASPSFNINFRPFLALNFTAMFGICLLAHGELARRQPLAEHLTAYYLLIALGGALGGVAVALVAPLVFNTFFEWRITMFVAAIVSATILLYTILNDFPGRFWRVGAFGRGIRWLILILLLLPTGLVLIDLVEYLHVSNTDVLTRERNFFGALSIRDRYSNDPEAHQHVLQHGITTHGTQFVADDRRGMPTSYYGTQSGVGRTLNFFRDMPNLGGLRAGAVGLGTGTIAAYIGDGDSIDFYEINPVMPEIAENEAWFTYLADCRTRGGKIAIYLGDARLTLEQEAARLRFEGQGRAEGSTSGQGPRLAPRYHVLVLDAFSGDAIPVHLLTEEAFAIYLTRLATAATDGIDGALAVHISNRYLDLEPVVRAAAERFGLEVALVHNSRDAEYSIYSSDWMILTNNVELLAALSPYADPPGDATPPAILWTDNDSNLFDVLK